MKALITGSSSGIGLAVAKRFLSLGHEVVGIDLLPPSLANPHYHHHIADIKFESSLPDIEGVEVLVNNAGIRKDNLLIWMEPQDWYKVLGIALNSFYNVTRPLMQPMLRKKYGRIVNIASLSGLKGLPGQTNYSAAKGGVIAATKALAQEVGRKGITVNAVAPGFIKTDMVEGLDESALKTQIPAGRFGLPEEVAELVGFLASPNAAYITGEVISINGGLYS